MCPSGTYHRNRDPPPANPPPAAVDPTQPPAPPCLLFPPAASRTFSAVSASPPPIPPANERRRGRREEEEVALRAAVLCGDSADWMWHLELPRPQLPGRYMRLRRSQAGQNGEIQFTMGSGRVASPLFFAALEFQDCEKTCLSDFRVPNVSVCICRQVRYGIHGVQNTGKSQMEG